jgi:hypothetical protein
LRQQFADSQKNLEQESLQRRQLAQKIVEVETARSEFASQANSARELVKAHEDSIRSLNSRIREHQEEIDRLHSSLESQIAEGRRKDAETEALEKQTVELNQQLAEKGAEQQRWHQRESELELCIRQQRQQIADSAEAATVRETELAKLRSTIDDLQVIQSALCDQVRELTNRRDAAFARIKELEAQSSATARIIQAQDQELAALRHAILDAARVGTKINTERLQVECQTVDGWKRLMATLLHTPLSTMQRGLVSEITCALEAWKKGRATAASGLKFQAELPDLQQSEFNCAEVIEEALAAARKHAEETGVRIQTALVGEVPTTACGNPQQIHQLITLLSNSLVEVDDTENLELQVSLKANQKGAATMLVSFVLCAKTDAETLCLRLRTLGEASSKLRTLNCGEPELAFSSVWQLAVALGASPTIKVTADGKLQIEMALPLPNMSSICAQEVELSHAPEFGPAATSA